MIGRGFGAYHPIISFMYFVCILGFSMFFMHPICLGVSLVCAFSYLCVQRGGKGACKSLVLIIPVMVFTAVLNPLFSHEGMTVIGYLPDRNPLTAESVVYGLCAGVMLAAVMCWFFACTHIMTSDKLIYIFGRILPALSLILSMTLRFVPEFTRQTKEVADAQKCMGRDAGSKNIIAKAKAGLSVLSAMVTRALENSIETADSMKARGYGATGRTAYSMYRFERRDGILLTLILFLTAIVIFGMVTGNMAFEFYPLISGSGFNIFFAAYALLCGMPVITEIWEVRRWARLKSKI